MQKPKNFSRRAHSTRGETLFGESWTPHLYSDRLDQLELRAAMRIWTRNDLQDLKTILNTISTDSERGNAPWNLDTEEKYFVVQLPLPWLPPSLPSPYGYKGGVARELLGRILRYPTRPPRDLDLVRRGPATQGQDAALAKQYMPHDYLHGATVEFVSSIDSYMDSRDLTINEVLLFGNQLLVSPFAAVDILQRTLRPTRYRGGSLSQPPQLSGNIMLKMLRLRAELKSRGEAWRIVGIPSEVVFSDNELAIHLEKALQLGDDIAECFLIHVRQAGYLNSFTPPLLNPILKELDYLCLGEGAIIKSLPPNLR